MGEIIGNNVEGFVLVDVDGVVLASPLDTIEIVTPEKFEDVVINLERTKNHGIDYEFSDPDTKYIIDNIKHENEAISGGSLLSQLKAAKGVDFNCLIEYRVSGVLKYQGKLMGLTSRITDVGVEVNSVRVNFDDLFRTRKKTKVAMNATTTIDDIAITPPTAIDTFLHSKAIVEKGRNDFGVVDPDDGYNGSTATNSVDYAVHDYLDNVVADSFDEVRNRENGLQKSKQDVLDDGKYRLKNYKKRDVLLSKVQFDVNIDYVFTAGAFDITSGTIKHYVIITDELGVIKSEYLINTENVPFGSSTTSVNVTFTSEQNDIVLNDNDEIYCYSIISVTTGSVSGYIPTVTPVSIVFNCEFEVTVKNSIAKMYDVFDVFDHILEVITNQSNVFKSTFFESGGGGEKNRLANGAMIRGFAIADKPMEVSFNEMLEYAMSVFGLGYAIVDVSGTIKVLMEQYSHFYQDKLITTIEEVIDGSFIIETDTELFSNEINIGYKEYPSGNDKEDSNSIDEFLTEHDKIFPVKTVNKKAVIKCPIIHSGYKIESIRKQTDLDTSASDDEKIFGIAVTDGLTTVTARLAGATLIVSDATENTLTIYAAYLDIKAGDTITISDTASFNGAYVVSSVIEGMNTILNCVSVTHNNTAVGGSFDFTLSVSRYRAERNDAFDVLDGVISPETVYNARHNIVNMLFNQSLIINTAYILKAITEKVKTSQAKINGLMRSQLKVSELDSTLDPGRQTIIQNQDLEISNINQNQKLLSGNLLIFECSLTQLIMQRIIDACINVAVDDINFGYLSVKYIDETYKNGFVKKMAYKPLSNTVAFILREKYVESGSLAHSDGFSIGFK